MAPPVNPQWSKWVASPKDLGAHASVAGWRSYTDIATAVAIALAESGGRAYAIGGPNSDGTYDYGCWQINEGAHPEKFQGVDWSNPQTNAKMAFAVYTEAGNSWRPWSVFNSGKYKQFEKAFAEGVADSIPGGADPLSQATELLEGLGEEVAESTGIDAVGEAINNIGGAVYKAGQWLGDADNWIRVAQVVVGGGLMIAALTIVARPLLENVTPVGKIAKVLK